MFRMSTFTVLLVACFAMIFAPQTAQARGVRRNLFFARPAFLFYPRYFGWNNPYWNRNYYGYGYVPYFNSFNAHALGNIAAFGRTIDYGNNGNWCAEQFPINSWANGNHEWTCKVLWQGNWYSYTGRNQEYALAYARRQVCLAGGDVNAIWGLENKCW